MIWGEGNKKRKLCNFLPFLALNQKRQHCIFQDFPVTKTNLVQQSMCPQEIISFYKHEGHGWKCPAEGPNVYVK